jgi:hypothetical protein
VLGEDKVSRRHPSKSDTPNKYSTTLLVELVEIVLVALSLKFHSPPRTE